MPDSDDPSLPRQMVINQALTKPMMLLGCDRRLLLMSSLAYVYIGFNLGLTRGNVGITMLAIALWFATRFGLKLMGKSDPLMLDVFRRSLLYKSGRRKDSFFFPARSSLDSKAPAHVKKRWL